jgi:hypothetical protein
MKFFFAGVAPVAENSDLGGEVSGSVLTNSWKLTEKILSYQKYWSSEYTVTTTNRVLHIQRFEGVSFFHT